MARWARPSRNLMDRLVEVTDLVFEEAVRPAALAFMLIAVGWMLRHW